MSTIIVEPNPGHPVERPSLPRVEPCVVVIFGASGDLTRRKLMPALFHLKRAGCLTSFQILGIGHDALTDDEFCERLREGIRAQDDLEQFGDNEWNEFAERIHYISGELNDKETYRRIAAGLEELASQGASRNRLYYLATPPSLAPAIVQG